MNKQVDIRVKEIPSSLIDSREQYIKKPMPMTKSIHSREQYVKRPMPMTKSTWRVTSHFNFWKVVDKQKSKAIYTCIFWKTLTTCFNLFIKLLWMSTHILNTHAQFILESWNQKQDLHLAAGCPTCRVDISVYDLFRRLLNWRTQIAKLFTLSLDSKNIVSLGMNSRHFSKTWVQKMWCEKM